VPLTHRSHRLSATYRAWIGVRSEDLQCAFRVSWQPDYLDLRLNGLPANVIQPQGLLAAPVHLPVRDPEPTPYHVSSPNAVFGGVIDYEWPHETVLDACLSPTRSVDAPLNCALIAKFDGHDCKAAESRVPDRPF